MSNAVKSDTPHTGGEWKPVPLLEKIKKEGRVWGDLAQQYGVENPDPPWKTSLEGTCEALGGNPCDTSAKLDKQWLDGQVDRQSVGDASPLPALERRWEEDELAETIYKDVPFPERQLLALAHSLIKRGLVNEEELARQLQKVHQRLTSA